MSTTSTATALAEPCPTVGDDDDEIANWICILVFTCADGTFLCPTSFQQEDVVVMCEGLGWECPKGVLQLPEMETVPTFQSSSEMMATIHQLAAAMVWCGDPTVLCVWPLSAKQVRDHVATGSSCPLGISMQTLVEGMESQPAPTKPNPDDGL